MIGTLNQLKEKNCTTFPSAKMNNIDIFKLNKYCSKNKRPEQLCIVNDNLHKNQEEPLKLF